MAQAHEGQARRLGVALAAPHEDRQEVTDEVVDADERLARPPRETLRGLHADEQRAHQARPVRDGDGVHVCEPHPRAVQGAAHDRTDVAQVVARRKLGHDAAVGCVDAHLRVHDVGEHAARVVDQRCTRLVAGRLEA